MLQVNSYFDGKVKSIALDTKTLPSTVGVMAPGEYTFKTADKEIMSVVSGEMKVKLPGETTWQTFMAGQVFEIEAGLEFDLIIEQDVAYLCQYIK